MRYINHVKIFVKRFSKAILACLACILIASYAQHKFDNYNNANNNHASVIRAVKATKAKKGQPRKRTGRLFESNQLAKLNYTPGTKAVVNVNHGKSTLNRHSWKYDHVIYSRLDRENRTSHGNTAWIDKNNLAHDNLRTRQIVEPTGYHQKRVNGNYVVNRGHEIAYSLSKGIDKQGKYNPRQQFGDQNNLRNLFTQTAFSNQDLQAIYEGKIRNALYHGEKVIFQAKPIFQGKDLMAKGVQLQAVSTNGKLNFNVYVFNVQPDFMFNYKNGYSRVNKAMRVQVPKNIPHYRDSNNKRNNRYYKKFRNYRHHYLKSYMKYRIAKELWLRHRGYRNQDYHYRPYHRYYRYKWQIVS